MLPPSEHARSAEPAAALRRGAGAGLPLAPAGLGVLTAGLPPSRPRLPGVGLVPWLITGGTLLLAWAALWNKLRADWNVNDQYQYGWFVPPLAVILLALRWTDRPAPAPTRTVPGWSFAGVCAGVLCLLLPIRLIEEPNPDWRLCFWLHAALLAFLSLACFLWVGGKPWLRHFAFPVGFLLLAVPWPSGLEQSVVQSLMRGVAAISAEGMNVLGIPAIPRGNLIHIRDQTVGVSEACSGIRSLQTTLMAGLLLGELSRLRWRRRLALLGCGLALAMVANVFRSSLLVWIAARHGAAALDRVHDFAGFSVLLIVFAGLLWFDRTLARGNGCPARGENQPADPRIASQRWIPAAYLAAAAAWLVAVEATVAAWYGLYAPPLDQVPRWTVAPPAGAPGLQHLAVDHRTSQMLRYDQGISARWNRVGPPDVDCNLFFFRWEPGHASTTQAEMHQPHICLTASGLTEVSDAGVEPVTTSSGVVLPVRRYEFTLRGRAIFVFFVAWQDRAGAQTLATRAGTRWDRLQAVMEHRANLGRQTLELVAVGPRNAREANAWFEQEINGLVRPIKPAAQ